MRTPLRYLGPAVLLLTCGPLHAATYTYPDLVDRLTDLERLAILPPKGETAGLASSYDRASQYDAATDQYLKWNANGDGSGFIREEGDMVVLADLQGPGCIWRTWSAASDNGHLKIYLDGAAAPVVDMPFFHFFKDGPFHWPYLVCYGVTPTGWTPGSNNYVPIPFQKSCKIVGEKGTAQPHTGWGKYYHFNYTLFPPGTVVPTFQMPLAAPDTAVLDAANEKLGRCGDDPAGPRTGQKTETPEVTVPPNGTALVADLSGAEAVTALKVKLALPADPDAQRTFLRQLTLRITWDDEKTPAVWSPLGDFFGIVGGAGSYRSLPMGFKEDGTFYSYWYMPFASHARIEVGNDSGQLVTLHWEVTHAPLDRPIAELGRFHAKWHRDAFLPERKDRAVDWTLAAVQGRGRYVGTMLHVWNPRGGWWGEGDEKFFVDGEKFPSIFGTGSEDYFGYAWGCPNRFERPFHAQPLNENNTGNIDNSRWHIPDDIPFQTSFEGCIEKFFPNASAKPYAHTSLFAAQAYWYLAADGTDPYGAVPVEQRIGYWTPPVAEYSEPGVIEGEGMEPVAPLPANQALSQPMWDLKPATWSGDRQLSWRSERAPGIEKLGLRFHVEKAAKYRVIVRLTKAPDCGIFQLGIDGQNLGTPFDLYDPGKPMPADPVEAGTAELTAGDHVLTVVLAGKNSAVTERAPFFGLDYLKLVPLPAP